MLGLLRRSALAGAPRAGTQGHAVRRWMASSSTTLSESIQGARDAADVEAVAAEADAAPLAEPRRVWTNEKHVRHSPKRMNVLCTQVRAAQGRKRPTEPG